MDQDEIDAILKAAGNNPQKKDDGPELNADQEEENLVATQQEEKTERTDDNSNLPNLENFAGSNIEILLDVPLEVSVELGRTKIVIKDLMQLGPGSIIELDKLIGEPVDLLVNDNLIARGEVVVFDENFGIRITDIVTPAQRLRSLR